MAVLIYAKVFCVAREQCRQAEHGVSTSLGRASDIALANASSSGRPLFCNEDRPSAPAADFVGDHAPQEGDALHEGYSGLSCGGPAKGTATYAHPPTSNIKSRNIGRIIIVSTSRFIQDCQDCFRRLSVTRSLERERTKTSAFYFIVAIELSNHREQADLCWMVVVAAGRQSTSTYRLVMPVTSSLQREQPYFWIKRRFKAPEGATEKITS